MKNERKLSEYATTLKLILKHGSEDYAQVIATTGASDSNYIHTKPIQQKKNRNTHSLLKKK